MLRNIQNLGRGQRLLLFILIFVGGLLLLLALTALLILLSVNASPRQQAAALVEGVTVREFAVLPDDDAYPAAVTVGPTGMVYTGSFSTGALWAIDAGGAVTEVTGSRDAIGAVAGLAAAPDGSLFIVDQNDADVRTSGGVIRRLLPDGTLTEFATIDDERGFVSPDDIALDPAGSVYVSDRGRDEVWRFDPDGSGAVWWRPPPLDGAELYEPTGLAYDPIHAALIVTDGSNNLIYRVALADGQTEILYAHGQRPDAPGFDGVTLMPDGTLMVAALGLNRIARLEGDQLVYIAGGFRGVSDVDVSPTDNRLVVANFDSFSLVVPAVQPRLPFALDVIELTTRS